MTSAISGTIVAVQHSDDRTVLQVASGGNGSKRQDSVVLPGRRESLTSGKAVKLVNFVRSRDGSLVPGESAKLSVTRLDPPAPIAEPAIAHEEPSAPEQTQTVSELPTPTERQTPDKSAPIRQHAGGLMIFSDKKTRRAVFNRAVEVAREFADHIRKSGQIIKIQGRDYVTVAGWSLLPAFESANCYTVAYQIGEDGTAYAEAVVEKDGEIASRGFGACSQQDRPKINDRLAMAQTRARGSALKARYSVLVTLAGYEASLADEVEATVAPARVVTAQVQPTAPPTKPTDKQIAFALSIFDNDKSALLQAVAKTGLLVFQIEDVPVPILKAIVEQRVNDRKRRRAEQAAAQAA
jgi:hypothetical protein